MFNISVIVDFVRFLMFNKMIDYYNCYLKVLMFSFQYKAAIVLE